MVQDSHVYNQERSGRPGGGGRGGQRWRPASSVGAQTLRVRPRCACCTFQGELKLTFCPSSTFQLHATADPLKGSWGTD